jgi:glucose-1-phosphate cytidylyltransferase
MKVVILCGGRGTRLNGERPKPLVEVGGRPIVGHVMAIYAAQGFREFTLLTGHGGPAIAEWAAGEARVECVDTGLDTPTGGRVHAVRDRLREPFCLTYADGVADIDLGALLAAHERSGALATMTVVRPELPFGVAMVEDGRVVGFREKPRAEQWVNGGFFVMEPAALEYLGPDAVLEREPLERLAADGALAAYRHEGFWRCLDTVKDALALEEECARGAPWLREPPSMPQLTFPAGGNPAA